VTLSIASPTAAPPPATGIRVWRARLDRAGWPGADRLPTAERERAARLRVPLARERWVAARWALRDVLAHCLDEDPVAIELRIAPGGKPMLADPTGPLRFNLSHSGELALVAVAWEREVGVDVERIAPRRDLVALALRGLDPAVASRVAMTPPERRPAAFYAAWSRREAIAKCHGTGLGAPPPEEAEASVSDLDVGPGFAAALAVSGRPTPARPLPAAAARGGRWRPLECAAASSSPPAPLR
jgi:4'-phosphopantetheinyl transferase